VYTLIQFLGIINCPDFDLKHSISETAFCLRLQVSGDTATSIKLVPYNAVNRKKVSIRQLPLYFPSHSSSSSISCAQPSRLLPEDGDRTHSPKQNYG
jgi:hypothetical protein